MARITDLYRLYRAYCILRKRERSRSYDFHDEHFVIIYAIFICVYVLPSLQVPTYIGNVDTTYLHTQIYLYVFFTCNCIYNLLI